MNYSYLVPFDELPDFFSRQKSFHTRPHLSGVLALMGSGNRIFANVSDRDAFERFHGTWWEVVIPAGREFSPRCMYVADSLTDALRLKPGISLSPWSSSIETMDPYLDDAEDWDEEIDEIDFFDHAERDIPLHSPQQ